MNKTLMASLLLGEIITDSLIEYATKLNTEYIGLMKLTIEIGSLANTVLMGWVRRRSSQSRFSSSSRDNVMSKFTQEHLNIAFCPMPKMQSPPLTT